VPPLAKPILTALGALIALAAIATLGLNLYLQSSGVQQRLAAAVSSGAGSAPTIGATYYTPWSGLVVSGVKIPLGDLEAAMRESAAINYGDKPIARVNNEEAYLKGANPFQHADDTRVPNGGPYVNHSDPVAAIAGDVLTLQDRLESTQAANIRTNDQARRFIEYAIERSTWLSPEQRRRLANVEGIETAPVDPNPMSAADRAKLQGLLLQLHRHGLYFGSAKIEAAAREAATQNGARPADNETGAFVRAVYEGQFRYASLDGYDAGDLARDVALGLNRWTAVTTEVFRAEPSARDDIALQQIRNTATGFAERMKREGGTLAALGLRVPPGMSSADAEQRATRSLFDKLVPRARAAGRTTSAQSLYEQFQQLGGAQRQAIAREIQGELDGPRSRNLQETAARGLIGVRRVQAAPGKTQESNTATRAYNPGDGIGTPWGNLEYLGLRGDGFHHVRGSDKNQPYRIPLHIDTRDRDAVRAWAIRSVERGDIDRSVLIGPTSRIWAPAAATGLGVQAAPRKTQ
jgi:hypothetical protein